MKIEAIDVYRVRMPLVYPFRTAFGNDEYIESILVRLCSEGKWGWGESSPWSSPGYSAECAETAFCIIRKFLAPLLLGERIVSGTQLQDLLSPVKANFFAKAALDNAWWELFARTQGVPLWKALGGKRNVVDVGADFGVMESVERLLDTIRGAVDKGFKRVKLKYRPGWDLDMIAAVRKRFPDTRFHVDCNSAYTLEDTQMLKRLDEYKLAMIEQPLMHDDLVDHATLQEQLSTPICLDESITSPVKARQAAQLIACGWINIKPGRVGGLTNAVAIHDVCEKLGIPCWVGGMLESSLGGYQCLALATLPNFQYPNDIFPSKRFYVKDLCTPELVLSDPSQVKALDDAGSGVEPEPNRLQTYALDSFHLNAKADSGRRKI